MKLSFLPFLRPKTSSPEQVISEHWSEREAILSQGINLFCWRRPEIIKISHYLEQITRQDVVAIKTGISLTTLDQDFKAARKIWDPNFEVSANAFWEDAASLAKDFLIMSKRDAATLHLRLVNNDACTKFHLDGYDLRLFTTYYGPGTEWLPEKAVNRSALGKTNHLIVKDPALIQQMQPFDVGIMKGEVPSIRNSTPGIVHRSPSISESQQKRIIMRIDI